MKKIITLLLAALLALCTVALAEEEPISGNAGSGGIAATGVDGELYFALNGLQCMDIDEETYTIVEGEVKYLQCANDALYFVACEMTGEDEFAEEYMETPYVLDYDGNLTAIGAPLRRGTDYEYSNDYNYTLYDTFNGYWDMTVYGDHIYFIGNSGAGGEYETIALNWETEGETAYSTRYTSGACVYRMDLDGGNLTELISGLGNGQAHMAISNDRIAVASCFQNSVYAYDFSNFMLYDLDGNLLETKVNGSPSRHSSMYKEDQEYTVIINAIQTDGTTIYASLGDSEGDFASSRFVNVEDVDETIAFEAYYTPSLCTGDGLIYMRSDVQDVFWDEAIENSVRLVRRDAAGNESILAYIPSEFADYEMKLALTGGRVYVLTGDRLLRVDLESGDVDEFDDTQFVVCPACDPAYAGGTQLTLANLEPVMEPETTEEPMAVVEPVATEEPMAIMEPVLTEEPMAIMEPMATEEPIAVGEAEVLGEADAAQSEYLLPDSDTRLYTREELYQYDKETLAFMRNEILARHGYPFQKEKYREYFGSKSWYTADSTFVYDRLNSIEMANVETIKSLE